MRRAYRQDFADEPTNPGGMIKEFREFILRGNVVDLAIAVVIGTAFGLVVQAAVSDLITPLVAAIVGEPSFGGLSFTINGSVFKYGHFLNQVVSFLSIAAVVFFLIVKPLNLLLARRQADDVTPEAQAPAEDVRLLMEIRDLLRAQAS
jgi:large conductance mechanosensitive channel